MARSHSQIQLSVAVHKVGAAVIEPSWLGGVASKDPC